MQSSRVLLAAGRVATVAARARRPAKAAIEIVRHERLCRSGHALLGYATSPTTVI